MINPNRVHRAKGEIVKLGHGPGYGEFQVKVTRGSSWTIVKGWDCPASLSVGDIVNVQCSFSIMTDGYTVKTIRKAPARFQKPIEFKPSVIEGAQTISRRSTAKLRLVAS